MFPIDAFRNTLTKAVGILETLDIRFHLTGGITTVVYGEPRLTQDIDLVIDHAMAARNVERLVQLLNRSDFLFDEPSLRSAIETEQMFQLLDQIEALKLDLYPREMIPGELQRSVRAEIFHGQWLPLASRVDAALSKLLWVSKGSHKSRRDFRQILRQASDDEQEAITEAAAGFGLRDLLQTVLAEPDELTG